jgi:hypothetical protein
MIRTELKRGTAELAILHQQREDHREACIASDLQNQFHGQQGNDAKGNRA